jgi:hypothetical protein
MTVKIDSKIKSYKVLKEDEKDTPKEVITSDNKQTMHENISRPEDLFGVTYKLKSPQTHHALYITINDIILNHHTDHEERRPYEIFINSRNIEHYQWIVALTRVISAVFRKGGDSTFLVDELKAVFDPSGGYYKKGGIYVPSIVADIGYILEKHMKYIGMIVHEEDQEQKLFIDSKRKEFNDRFGDQSNNEFPSSATLCPICSVKAVIIMDGCKTCLNCGDSKCG